MSLPKYNYEDLTVEDRLNQAKKRLIKSFNEHNSEKIDVMNQNDPTDGRASKVVNDIIKSFDSLIAVLNTMSVVIVSGPIAGARGQQAMRFIEPRNFIEYSIGLNRVTSSLSSINQYIEQLLPSIQYVDYTTIEQLKRVISSFNIVYNTVLQKSYDPVANELIVRPGSGTQLADFRALRSKWNELVVVKKQLDELMTQLVSSYNEFRKQTLTNNEVAQQLIPNLHGAGWLYMPNKYL